MAKNIKTNYVADNMANQLILLCVLEKMEIPLSETSLIDICTAKERQWLTYLDFKEVLNKLLEFKFISKVIVDNEFEKERYKITSQGIECLGYFYLKIPTSIRESISQFCKENKMKFKKKQEFISKYEKNSDNTYTCIFKIISPNEAKTIFEIKMQYPSRDLAIRATDKWRESAPNIYSSVYELLGD